MADVHGTQLVYINLDNGMVSQLLRTRVLKRLRDEYDGVYNESNVMISGGFRRPSQPASQPARPIDRARH
jgi:hypothetical protein